MRIRFLGTAAAEGWPGIFCTCEACRKARALGGRNIRTRSSALIDDVLLVDFPPDTYWHAVQHGLALDRVRHLLVTHSHEDHFYPQDLGMRREPFAYLGDAPALAVFGNDAVGRGMAQVLRDEALRPFLTFEEVSPFRPFAAGDATVTPLLAAHTDDERCLLYLIERGGKRMLYGHDTGRFPEATFDHLAGTRLDVATFDCTFGPTEDLDYHMGFYGAVKVRDELAARGCVDADTKAVVTHFSHNGKLMHDEYVALAAPHGFLVAYDGMVLEA